MKFKAGDWVTVKGTLPNDKFQLTAEEVKNGEILIAHFRFGIEEWEYWQPKEGEWCWFWSEGDLTPDLMQFSCIGADGKTYLSGFAGYEYCEPFTNRLPSLIRRQNDSR